MEYNQNTTAAINHQRTIRIKCLDHSWLFHQLLKKTGRCWEDILGSWGHALVVVAVVERFKDESMYGLPAGTKKTGRCVAFVASVSVWFRSKERPRNGILGFGRARNETRAKHWKWEEGEGEEGNAVSFPPPFRSFTYAIFRAVFDSRSSFFAPKPHGNACYAG